jgi:16S rRNA (adenine1518-N6/adenine1519-N6)-dimethyltransferase
MVSATMVRLGQNFLLDVNLLDAIVRESGVGPRDVVLEVGGGDGALTARLAPRAARLHVVELDRSLEVPLRAVAAEHGNVDLHWGDAMRLDLAGLAPEPTRMVANLPYSVATPVLLRTIAELPGIEAWLVMVQREIADRLRAGPGSRLYGGPSVLAQLACDVEMVRSVDRAVFRPRPRVDSALLRLTRRGPGATARIAEVVRGAFAHRRKELAGSLELAGVADRPVVRAALGSLGIREDARAEALAPEQFAGLAAAIGERPA